MGDNDLPDHVTKAAVRTGKKKYMGTPSADLRGRNFCTPGAMNSQSTYLVLFPSRRLDNCAINCTADGLVEEQDQ